MNGFSKCFVLCYQITPRCKLILMIIGIDSKEDDFYVISNRYYVHTLQYLNNGKCLNRFLKSEFFRKNQKWERETTLFLFIHVCNSMISPCGSSVNRIFNFSWSLLSSLKRTKVQRIIQMHRMKHVLNSCRGSCIHSSVSFRCIQSRASGMRQSCLLGIDFSMNEICEFAWCELDCAFIWPWIIKSVKANPVSVLDHTKPGVRNNSFKPVFRSVFSWPSP